MPERELKGSGGDNQQRSVRGSSGQEETVPGKGRACWTSNINRASDAFRVFKIGVKWKSSI